MKILFVSMEVAPFTKVGGLADVAKALPDALHELGTDVTVLTPWFHTLPERYPQFARVRTVRTSTIELGTQSLPISFYTPEDTVAGPKLIFVDEPRFLSRDVPYAVGQPVFKATQEPEGYFVFGKAVTDWWLSEPRNDWVLHLNDYHAGLAAPLLKRYSSDANIVISVHNFAHQGSYAFEVAPLLGLPQEQLAPYGPLEFHGTINLLKGAICSSDVIVTVSPTYREEALREREIAFGLEGVLRERADRFFGIMNGIDETWNPRNDPYLSAHFDADQLTVKHELKRLLLAELKLPQAALKQPLVAVISRLVPQKGIDLILEVAERLLAHPATLVVLGAGEAAYEADLMALEARYVEQCRCVLRLDEVLAHRIEAGADLFLMPSRFEPCGLNQMYSLAMGTVPVVRRTGGLADSVWDVRAFPDGGTGFTFDEPTADGLWGALEPALQLFRDEQSWQTLMRRGMAEDHRWETSARAYLEIYRNLLNK